MPKVMGKIILRFILAFGDHLPQASKYISVPSKIRA
jgi:hypothetical protein